MKLAEQVLEKNGCPELDEKLKKPQIFSVLSHLMDMLDVAVTTKKLGHIDSGEQEDEIFGLADELGLTVDAQKSFANGYGDLVDHIRNAVKKL